MGTVAFVVIVGKEERIGAILGPHVVELRCIPQRLVGDLWHADWVRRWACTCGTEGFFGCVVHVILVVGRVDILAVPASGCWRIRLVSVLHTVRIGGCLRWEVMHSHDAAFAGLGWEIWGLRETSVLVLQTNKAKTGVLLRVFYSVGGGRSHGHAEALRMLAVHELNERYD